MIVVDEKTRLEHIASALSRNLPHIEAYHPHGGRWHICAGGPSLRKEIKRIKKAKGTIVSVNGTHDYLLSKKITPGVFIMVDPQEHNERFVRHPVQGTAYLIAAHCHPKVFDRLKGCDCRVWFPMDYDLPVPVQIGGGTTVGLRAINIGYTLGYRDIHLWGFDGCVKETHHAYPQIENDDDPVKVVKYRGKKYKMTEWMIAQADNFEEMLKQEHDFKLTVHTNGVIKHIGDSYASS